jgi:hypothetical protein
MKLLIDSISETILEINDNLLVNEDGTILDSTTQSIYAISNCEVVETNLNIPYDIKERKYHFNNDKGFYLSEKEKTEKEIDNIKTKLSEMQKAMAEMSMTIAMKGGVN